MKYEQIRKHILSYGVGLEIEKRFLSADLELWTLLKPNNTRSLIIVFKMSGAANQWGWFMPTINQIRVLKGVLPYYYLILDEQNKKDIINPLKK